MGWYASQTTGEHGWTIREDISNVVVCREVPQEYMERIVKASGCGAKTQLAEAAAQKLQGPVGREGRWMMSMPCPKCGNEVYREDRYECPCDNISKVQFPHNPEDDVTISQPVTPTTEKTFDEAEQEVIQEKLDEKDKRIDELKKDVQEYMAALQKARGKEKDARDNLGIETVLRLEDQARIAELEAAALTGHHEDCMSTDGRLPHVLGKSRLIFCNCTIGLEAQIKTLKAQIKAAAGELKAMEECSDGIQRSSRAAHALKILTSKTGKGGG